MSADKQAKPVQAVALRYDPERRAAPDLVAKGKGEVAQSILDLANKHGVPVREDADLLHLLAACDVGEEIPLELYTAVAELLAYLYRLNGELTPRGRDARGPGHLDRAPLAGVAVVGPRGGERIVAQVGERHVGTGRRLGVPHAQVALQRIHAHPSAAVDPGLDPVVGFAVLMVVQAQDGSRGQTRRAADRHQKVGVVRAVAAAGRRGGQGPGALGHVAGVLHVVAHQPVRASQLGPVVGPVDARRQGQDRTAVVLQPGFHRQVAPALLRGQVAGRARSTALDLGRDPHRQVGRRRVEAKLGVAIVALFEDALGGRADVQLAHPLTVVAVRRQEDRQGQFSGALRAAHQELALHPGGGGRCSPLTAGRGQNCGGQGRQRCDPAGLHVWRW